MKTLIIGSALSFGIFTQNNAMQSEDLNPPDFSLSMTTPTQHKHLMQNISMLVLAAREGMDMEIDSLIAQTNRNDNPREECQALTITIFKGHLSIVKKLLDFFGDNVSTSDADSAFAIACACQDQQTALAMITELCMRRSFVNALSTKGRNDARENARENKYSKVTQIFEDAQTFTRWVSSVNNNIAMEQAKPALRNNAIRTLQSDRATPMNGNENLYQQLLIAAQNNNTVFLYTFLARPTIDNHLSFEQLKELRQTVTDNQYINDKSKACIKQTLESIASRKGWSCIVL